MEPRRGPLTAGEKVQFTDRKGKKITDQLVAGGSTQTEHGLILHDDVIGKTEGTVILTVHAKREAQVNQVYPEKDKNKPWKSSRAIGGWEYAVMRPRLADYVLSMPRGAQLMYPKDIAQVIQLRGRARPPDHDRAAPRIRQGCPSQRHAVLRRGPQLVGSQNRRLRFRCRRTA